MRKLSFISLLIISFCSVSFFACKKAGPEGPAGPAGPVGPQGPTGPTGLTGTANVIYSRWTNGSTWTIDGTSGLNYYDIPATTLTQSILSTGSIQVYWAVLGDTVNHVRQLPFVETIGPSIYFHNPRYSVGNIKIETSNLGMATSNRYRYIFIPGGVLGGRYAGINFGDYQEVLQMLNIPE